MLQNVYRLWTRQLSHYDSANTGFVCDEAAVVGDTIKGTRYITRHVTRIMRVNWSCLYFVCVVLGHRVTWDKSWNEGKRQSRGPHYRTPTTATKSTQFPVYSDVIHVGLFSQPDTPSPSPALLLFCLSFCLSLFFFNRHFSVLPYPPIFNFSPFKLLILRKRNPQKIPQRRIIWKQIRKLSFIGLRKVAAGIVLLLIWSRNTICYFAGFKLNPECAYLLVCCRRGSNVFFVLTLSSPMVTICTTSFIAFNNSTFCPHSVFVCFVWIWEQTVVTICTTRFNTKILRSAHTVYLCVLCGFENKQRLFHYTALTDWFL